jgi:hypothetical protein
MTNEGTWAPANLVEKMTLIDRIVRKLHGADAKDAQDALASLVLAAREDSVFRERVMAVLELPTDRRESLVRSAVEEMKLRGEPAAVRAAFLVLATPEGAAAAAQQIERT